MANTLRRLKVFWNFIFQLKMAKTESWMLLTNWLQVRYHPEKLVKMSCHTTDFKKPKKLPFKGLIVLKSFLIKSGTEQYNTLRHEISCLFNMLG
jgi:hypothetical protein